MCAAEFGVIVSILQKEHTTADRTAQLASQFWSMPAAAEEYVLASVKQATDVSDGDLRKFRISISTEFYRRTTSARPTPSSTTWL